MVTTRRLSYAAAIREATAELLRDDETVFVFGQGLWSPWYVGASMDGLDKEFGRDRVIDSPVSENATTGAGIGAAIAGMKPIIVHPRMDFMLLAADQIANQASNWSYMFDGISSVPLVIRAIINRGGEQGAQHSQALQAWFAHLPGMKLVMPANAHDAKGLLIAAVRDLNPVMYIDDRWLYETESDVPVGLFETPLGKADIARKGSDLTIVTSSFLVVESLKAAERAAKLGIDVEVVDLRTIKPLDVETITSSARKTGRVLAIDGGWSFAGIAAEVLATISESEAATELKAPMGRLCLPEAPAPTSRVLEEEYYINADKILKAVERLTTH